MKDLLLEIKAYIEQTEETIDGEWGMGRTFEQLLSADALNDDGLYAKVLAAIEECDK